MLEDVLDIPNHIRDALWRVESAQLKPRPSCGFVVCGMGGSAIGAELARGLLSDRLTGPMVVSRSYRLPRWVTADWAVLASSYSGDTEETIESFKDAGEAGSHRWVAGTGGELGARARDAGIGVVGLPGFFQPRVTVGYMTVVSAYVAHLAGVAPDMRRELEQAADFLDTCKTDMAPLAKALASQIGDTPVVVHGASLTTAPARRWANQINENAKQLAFQAEIPEANHNLMEAWSKGTDGLGAIFLTDSGQSPRERRRMELTAETIEKTGAPVFSVESMGETRSERLFWSVMFGDLVSVELAALRGVDPMPVDEINSFKERLGKG
ncbi:MAG TPA: bifunctional phosphoglucose/phosphomannose isomerase [Solirubrobacterales bacterium]|nr:bifunctional phosphoglucose/phosphomannose isomerase [Solirubrobacterales bacterium]